LTLTPGLDKKKFSETLRRNVAKLANNTRHNIPLEVALQAVGAEYGVPMKLKSSARQSPRYRQWEPNTVHQ
jgi:hypothetical protein